MTSGRIEADARYNNKVTDILIGQPDYISDYADTFTKKTAATRYQYVAGIIAYVEWLKESGMDVSSVAIYKEIKPVHIQKYLNRFADKSSSYQARVYYNLKSFFQFLLANEWIERNPLDSIEAAKLDADINPVVLSKDESRRIRSAAEYGSIRETALQAKRRDGWRERDYAILQLGLSTGLRKSGIAEINVEDVDVKAGTVVVVEKGRKNRVMLLGQQTVRAIADWLVVRAAYLAKKGKHCDALFISNRCQRVSVDTINDIVGKYAEITVEGKHITPHKMRSTCASNLYEATGDIYIVMDQLGHSNLANTKRYAKISGGRIRQAADILDAM